ncbi:MAG: sugar ABC transporter substrate-binding protein [Roseiflexaceae bacterium]|nr:sugar ABC transporter substrate-binding protein [Roseiflexaceae bacterium]
MKRIPAFLAVLVLLIPLLAACGGQTTSTGSTQATLAPAAPSGEKAKIRLATWTGVDESKELQAVIDQINTTATTFEIVLEAQPADYYTKIQTNLAGGTAADLLWLSQEYITGYAQKGVLLDITDRLATDSQPAAKLADYYPSVLQTAQYNGKTYGLPWIAQPVVLYYNPKLFADAGVAPPDENWTWDTFKDAAAALTKDTDGDGKIDQYGTAFNGWPPIQMFIWQAGGEVISEDRMTSPIDSPEALAGANFYSDIIYNPKYAATEDVIKEQGFSELAKNGKVAMFYGGAGDDLDYAHTKDPKFAELKMALVPKGPKNRSNFAWTASTVINAATKNPEQAYAALVALTEGIQHWKIVAPRKSLATAEMIAASVPQKQSSAAMILLALPDSRSFRIVPKQSDWDKAFFDEFQDPLFHKKGTATDLSKLAMPNLVAALAP